MAPENPFPAGFDDCVEVVKSLLQTGDEYGIDTTRIVLAGSSAGGNLAAAVTHHLHNENRKLAGQVGCLKKKCRCFIAVNEVTSHRCSKGFIWHEDYSWQAERMPAGKALDGGQCFLICWLPCDFMGACATKKDKKNIFSVPFIHFQPKVKSTLFYPMLLTTNNFF